MKSIKLYLAPLLLVALFSTTLFSQNDFYNNKKVVKNQRLKSTKKDSISLVNYTTERDYNEIHRVVSNQVDSVSYNNNEYSADEFNDDVYNDEENRKHHNNDFAAEVVAEVVYNVIINVAFIVAAFWQ